MDDFYDPVYKGCTSPGTIFGVPMLPFILGTLLFAQLGVLAFMTIGLAGLVSLLVAYSAVYRWARSVSRNDEQRLLQMIMRMRMRAGQRSSIAYWGAVTFGASRVKGQR